MSKMVVVGLQHRHLFLQKEGVGRKERRDMLNSAVIRVPPLTWELGLKSQLVSILPMGVLEQRPPNASPAYFKYKSYMN